MYTPLWFNPNGKIIIWRWESIYYGGVVGRLKSAVANTWNWKISKESILFTYKKFFVCYLKKN